MCIAIVKQPNIEIPQAHLDYGYENNKDGCGLAYITAEGQLHLYTTLSYEEWNVEYQRCLAENPASPFFIHFRKETSGGITLENCHPFWVQEGEQVMMHNGTILNAKPAFNSKDSRSDTRIFNDTVLKDIPFHLLSTEGLNALVVEYIGSSKVVTMNRSGEIVFFNEDKHRAHWNDEKTIWYSNYSYNKDTKSIDYKPASERGASGYENPIWNMYAGYGGYHNVDPIQPKADSYYDKKYGEYSWAANYNSSWRENSARFAYIEGAITKWDHNHQLYRPVAGYSTASEVSFKNGISDDIYRARLTGELKNSPLDKLRQSKEDTQAKCQWCSDSVDHSSIHIISFEDGYRELLCTDCLLQLQDMDNFEPKWHVETGTSSSDIINLVGEKVSVQ